MDKVTINEIEYDKDSLSEEAQNILSHIGVIDSELARIVNVHSSLSAGRQVAVTQLIELVEKKDDN